MNGLGLTVPILVAVLCIPPIFAALGEEQAGFLLVIWAIVNSSALLDFGLGRALTLHIAKTDARDTSNDRIGIAFWLSIVLGAGFGIVLYLASGILAARLGRGADASAFQAIALSAPLIVSTTVLRGVLEARRKFVLINAIRIPTGTLNFVAPLLVIWLWQPDIVVIAWSLTLGRALTFSLFLVFVKRDSPGSLRHLSGLTESFDLIKSGGWLTVSSIAGPALSIVERFIIGSQLSIKSVTSYATPQEVVSRISIIPNAISITLFPELANDQLEKSTLDKLYMDCLGAVLILTAMPTLAIALFANEILTLWIGKDLASSSSLALQVFAIGGLAGAMAQIPFVLVQARGDARFTGILHLAEMIVFTLILTASVSWWALAGALATWMGRSLLDAVALFLRARRFAGFLLNRESASWLTLLAATLASLPLMWVEAFWPRVLALAIVAGLSLFGGAILLRSSLKDKLVPVE